MREPHRHSGLQRCDMPTWRAQQQLPEPLLMALIAHSIKSLISMCSKACKAVWHAWLCILVVTDCPRGCTLVKVYTHAAADVGAVNTSN